MGKFLFLVVFVAALAAVSVAQGVSEQSFRDAHCRREVQEKPLQACRQILHQYQTDEREGAGSVPLLEAQWDARERCCRQLQSVSRECRCSAIRGMVRDYEESMPPVWQGHRGSPGQQQEQGRCCGEAAEHHQQGGGYYGEEGRGQQGQVLRHEMPPPQQQEEEEEEEAGQGYYGGATAESQQRQRGGYYGERPRRQQQQQPPHGEGFYRYTSRRQQGQESYGEGAQQRQQQVGRVSLTKMQRYVARLPTVCQIEPMECSVFSDDQYY